MKFKIYTENKAVKEKEVYFKLVKDDETIDLTACDSFGQLLGCGYILSISINGLCLYENVDEEFGLPLDERGRIKVTDDE